MRILVINYEYPPLGGGGGIFSAQLVQAWIKAGHQVDVVTSQGLEPSLEKRKKGLNIYRVWAGKRKDPQKSEFSNLFWFIFSGYWKAHKLATKKRYDFINTHFAIPTGLIGYLLQRKRKLKNLLTLHGADIYDPSRKMSGHRYFITRKAIGLFIDKADFTIASSQEIKSKAQQYYKFKKEIKIIPLGYQLAEFIKKKDFSTDKGTALKIITIGRLVARKNLELLIRAVKELETKVSLTIIGDGPLKKELEIEVERLNLSKKVRFLGAVDEKRKIEELNKSDLYISSAIHEGFGIAFLEAMQVGLPIIASNKGGQIYFLEEERNALFFENKNLEDLVIKIKYFLKFRDKLKELGLNNQKLVKKFRIEKVAEEYLRLVK